MLRISQEQWRLLSQSALDAFVDRMCRHLTEVMGDRLNVPQFRFPNLAVKVREGILDAKSYGVNSEPDLRLYLECLILLGPSFPQQPWAARILTNPSWDGTVKMDFIQNHVIFGGLGT